VDLNTLVTGSFDLLGNVNTFASDMVVCGDFLVVAQVNAGTAPTGQPLNQDAVTLYNFAANPTSPTLISQVILDQNSASGVRVPANASMPAIVHHPTKRIVYVSGTSAANFNADFFVNVLSYESGSLQFIDRISAKTNKTSSLAAVDRRGRLVYRDGIIQYATNSPNGKCALVTIRIDDNNPLSIRQVSRTFLPPTSTNDCYSRLSSTPNGCLLVSSRSNVPGELGIFEPAAAGRQFINEKPMNVPSSVVLLAFGTVIFAGPMDDTVIPANTTVALEFRPSVTFYSNFETIDLTTPSTGTSNLFLPPANRTIMLSFDLYIVGISSPANVGPQLLFVDGQNASGMPISTSYSFSPRQPSGLFGANVSGKMIASATRPLRIRVQTAGTASFNLTASAFSLQYVMDL
jgi:hypothetical protein